MSTVKFGFIGTGNMGSALARAVCKSVSGDEILLSDASTVKAELLANEIKATSADIITVAEHAKYIFLGVKPQNMQEMISEILPVLNNRSDRFVLVTMAAGVSIEKIKYYCNNNYPIIRIMPNTPVSMGKGMILYTTDENVFMDELGEFTNALSKAGRVDRIEEKLIDAASAISGCGPAFVYMFCEAMADAGVECGLPRTKAIEYAAQTLSGAAELLLNSGKHPATLKDEVCSPKGTTIVGVHALEEGSFRGTVMDAIKASYNRTLELKN